jgi:formamidopyrimidine-DNA glycosylase
MPELPEVEATARLLHEAVKGATIESSLAPGVNVLKTFDPPLSALDGSTIAGVRRRGKLLLLDADSTERGHLTLLMHLMSAGRLQLFDKRGSLRDRTSRLLLRLDGDRELRLREFGTKQAAWARLHTLEGLQDDDALRSLGAEAWPDPPSAAKLRELLAESPRPLHSVLRDQQVIAGIGRTWVDDILHAAKLSPFKRGDDLSDSEAAALREAIAGELGRAVDHYVATWKLPLPDKQAKVARVHGHQGEPCPRCDTVLEAVYFEDYVMTYCPQCQTGGRILKDRRLSRLLK